MVQNGRKSFDLIHFQAIEKIENLCVANYLVLKFDLFFFISLKFSIYKFSKQHKKLKRKTFLLFEAQIDDHITFMT